MRPKKMRNRRRKRGVSLVEAVVGFLVIIPIGLAALDMYALMVATQQNEELAELAARAAATKGDEPSSAAAVDEILQHVQSSPIVQSVSADNVAYNIAAGQVTVTLRMDVKMPVPFPNYQVVTCTATSVEPIVSTPAAR